MAETKVLRAIITLTPSESKRIIGKAVARMEVVNRVLREGSIFISLGTTNAFVVEEITGKRIDKEHFSSGIITPHGPTSTSFERKLDSILIKRGEISSIKWVDTAKTSDQLGPKDLLIKGANAIDHDRNAAVITADPAGGYLNQSTWRAIKERGTKLVVPVGVEKTVPYSLVDLSRKVSDGRVRTWRQMGMPLYKIVLLPGEVVTEVEAFRILSSVEATPIACGGIGGAEGSVTLLLEGHEAHIKRAWDIASEIKGEAPIKADPQNMAQASFEKR